MSHTFVQAPISWFPSPHDMFRCSLHQLDSRLPIDSVSWLSHLICVSGNLLTAVTLRHSHFIYYNVTPTVSRPAPLGWCPSGCPMHIAYLFISASGIRHDSLAMFWERSSCIASTPLLPHGIHVALLLLTWPPCVCSAAHENDHQVHHIWHQLTSG